MKRHLGSIALIVTLLAGCSSMPGAASRSSDEHAAHHPPSSAQADDANVDRHMKMMQEMHQKMAAAKTPEERATLMKEHMKAMQDGMAMMGGMRGEMMMSRRMDMMEMMMRMMLDQHEASPTPSR
jgi:outer membrane murein-binding lipoprotein Lpp